MSIQKIKHVFTYSLVSGAVISSAFIPVASNISVAHAEDSVIHPTITKCFTGQQGRPQAPAGGFAKVPDEMKEKRVKEDSEIPVEYVDTPTLKQGETRVKEEGEKAYTLLGPYFSEFSDMLKNGRPGFDLSRSFISAHTVPANAATSQGKYRVEITNAEGLQDSKVQVYANCVRSLVVKREPEMLLENNSTMRVSADTTELFFYYVGGIYARKGGPFDKGPITVKIYDPNGAVIGEREFTDIYLDADKIVETDIPAKPRIIERGTAPVVTTKYVDETGKEIKPVAEEITAQPEADIPGYKFDKTEVVNGVTVHHYTALPKPAETPVETPVEPTQTPAPKLPDTGTDALGALVASLAVSMLGAVMLVIRKRKS